jgi:hypothetical protein
MDKAIILDNFLNDQYEQIFCDQCMDTFLTNVYNYDEQHVLLEKRGLGLEYFCNAIQHYQLIHIPIITRIAVLDENDIQINLPIGKELFQSTETEYRYIYIMEKLIHLDEDDSQFFNKNTQDLELFIKKDKYKALDNISKQYNASLAKDIEKLCYYYLENQVFIAWDLHANNLMKRVKTGEIIILDPYAVRV